MKIADAYGRLFAAGTIGEVPTGNLVWVDPVNGNDLLAVRGRLTVPFKSLTAAKEAAEDGDTILVLPGTYYEHNLLKDGVNWHFLPGASVVHVGAGAGAIFDTSSYGTNGPVDCSITGLGVFEDQSGSASGHVVHSAANGSALSIEARRLIGSNAACIKTSNSSSGSLFIDVRYDIHGGSTDCIAIQGGAPSNIIRAHSLYTSGQHCVYVTDGAVQLTAHTMQSGSDPAVSVEGGSGATVIRAFDILAGSAPAVYHDAANADLHIFGARVRSNGSGEYGRAVEIGSSSSDYKIHLMGCVLLASGDYSIFANSSRKVQFHCGCAANKAFHNVTEVGGICAVDEEVS
jgi:hypothetical protein